MTDRVRLTTNGPLVFVRWHTAQQRFEWRSAYGEPWRRIPMESVSVQGYGALLEIKAETEREGVAS